LKIINKSNANNRDILLKHLSNDAINFLCEIIFNIINLKVPLSKKTINSLRIGLNKNKSCFRTLSKKDLNIRKRRILIRQNGNGIGLILSAAIPIITQLIKGVLSKNRKMCDLMYLVPKKLMMKS